MDVIIACTAAVEGSSGFRPVLDAGRRPPLPREHREASCAVLLADATLFVLLQLQADKKANPMREIRVAKL